MERIDNWEEVKESAGSFEKLELGGHVCKILEVSIRKFNGKDGKEYEQLECRIDITDPDPQAGFYERRFKSDAERDALNAKWKGYYKLSVPKNDSQDFIKSNFKTFTTAIEHSNQGYTWNWDEKTLVGKQVGLIFGLREFIATDGNILTFTEPRFARGVENIEKAEIPNVKLANGEYMSYDDYKEKKNESNNSSEAVDTSSFDTASGNDLPF